MLTKGVDKDALQKLLAGEQLTTDIPAADVLSDGGEIGRHSQDHGKPAAAIGRTT